MPHLRSSTARLRRQWCRSNPTRPLGGLAAGESTSALWSGGAARTSHAPFVGLAQDVCLGSRVGLARLPKSGRRKGFACASPLQARVLPWLRKVGTRLAEDELP